MRVVFDVSVLLRFAMGSALVAGLLRRAAAGEYTVVSNDLLAEELSATASKPRLSAMVNRSDCDDLLAFLRNAADQASIVHPFPPCRDVDDAYLLAMARDGAADFLVTNDNDLLSVGKLGTCEIVTPEDFARRLGAETPGG